MLQPADAEERRWRRPAQASDYSDAIAAVNLALILTDEISTLKTQLQANAGELKTSATQLRRNSRS